MQEFTPKATLSSVYGEFATNTRRFLPGEFFVYVNGSSWELGKVKKVADEEGTAYYCWYSSGTTAARTPVECMHRLVNGNNGPQCHITVNDCLAFWDSRDRIRICDWFTSEELYRGIVGDVPLGLWHLPLESSELAADGSRLVEVG